MFGFGAPVGFWVGQETSHLVCLGVATSPLGSAEVRLQLRLFGQQLTSCSRAQGGGCHRQIHTGACTGTRYLQDATITSGVHPTSLYTHHVLAVIYILGKLRCAALQIQYFTHSGVTHSTHYVQAVHLAGPCTHSHPQLLHGRIVSLYVGDA